nr:hypothetical protein [uncultured Roseococcus sp.]
MNDIPAFCSLRSPAEQRAYAHGLRRALEASSHQVTQATQTFLEYEATLADGLAAEGERLAAAAYWLPSVGEDESYESAFDLLRENGAEYYVPTEIMRHGWLSSRWAVLYPISEEGDAEIEVFPTLRAAHEFCQSAREEAEGAEGRLAEVATEEVGLGEPAEPPPPPAEPEPFVQAPASTPPSVWTPERIARLDQGYAAGEQRSVTFAAVNALPGTPCASINSMHMKASSLGFTKRALAPAAASSALLAPAQEDEERATARAMILDDKGALDLVREFGWELTEAQAFAKAVRAAQKAGTR